MPEIDFKFVDNYLRDRFYRPFLRRLRFLYFGLDHDKDIFVLSDTEDTDFKYCESMQTTGLIKIKNAAHLEAIQNWFFHFGIDGSRPTLVYFGAMMTLFSKMSSGSADVKIRKRLDDAVFVSVKDGPETLIARPCDTHFTLTKLQGYVEKYQGVFFGATQTSHLVTLPENKNPNQLQRIPISCQDLYTAGLLDRECDNAYLILIPGLDMLLTKSLLKKDKAFSTGVLAWSEGSLKCINYGGYFADEDTSICVVRDNIFLFPKPKTE